MDYHVPSRTGNLLQRGSDSLVLPSGSPAPSLRQGGVGRVLASPIEYAVEGQEVLGLGEPKHEVGRPQLRPLFREVCQEFSDFTRVNKEQARIQGLSQLL